MLGGQNLYFFHTSKRENLETLEPPFPLRKSGQLKSNEEKKTKSRDIHLGQNLKHFKKRYREPEKEKKGICRTRREESLAKAKNKAF